MPKRHCSVALTPELIEAVERRRGVFSFSAYLEYLCWRGLRSLEREEEPIARRAVIRAR